MGKAGRHDWAGRSRRFAWSESGAATIEAVLWLPVFVFLLAMVADVALIFGGQAQILRVVQDTNRAVSIGRITSTDDAEAAILEQITGLTSSATAETTLVSGVIHSTVSVPLADLTATHLIGAFDSLSLTVTSQHMAEN